MGGRRSKEGGEVEGLFSPHEVSYLLSLSLNISFTFFLSLSHALTLLSLTFYVLRERCMEHTVAEGRKERAISAILEPADHFQGGSAKSEKGGEMRGGRCGVEERGQAGRGDRERVCVYVRESV